jgi:hypothetical protein
MKKSLRAEWTPSDVSQLIQSYPRYGTPRKIIEDCPELANKFSRSQIQTKITNLKKQGLLGGKDCVCLLQFVIENHRYNFISEGGKVSGASFQKFQLFTTPAMKRKRAEDMMRKLKDFNVIEECETDNEGEENSCQEEICDEDTECNEGYLLST